MYINKLNDFYVRNPRETFIGKLKSLYLSPVASLEPPLIIAMQHDNAPSHTAKVLRDTIFTLGCQFLPHLPYSPDLSPSDFDLFWLMSHTLSIKHVNSYGDVKKELDDWTTSKDASFFWEGIHNLQRDAKNALLQ